MRRIALLFLFGLSPAFADENLVSGLSQDTIEIRSNYNGAEITVFGAVERPQTAKPDIVVVVRGPERDMRVLRKERVAGIWINRDRVLLHAMPSYYFVAGTVRSTASRLPRRAMPLCLAWTRYGRMVSRPTTIPSHFARRCWRGWNATAFTCSRKTVSNS